MSNEDAKKILDSIAKRCGYTSVELNYYTSGKLKWHPYVHNTAGQCNMLYSQSKDGACRYISIIGSGHSYAECLKTMLRETSKGCDIRIDNFLDFSSDEWDKVFLRRGMTEDMLQIEIDLRSVKN